MLREPENHYDDAKSMWIIDEEVVAPSRGYTLIVPKGFETDLASIPRALWETIAPFELSYVAPICHDWLYEHGGQITVRTPTGDVMHTFTKAETDLFFLDLMAQQNVPAWKRDAAYAAVCECGASSWKAAPAASVPSPSAPTTQP